MLKIPGRHAEENSSIFLIRHFLKHCAEKGYKTGTLYTGALRGDKKTALFQGRFMSGKRDSNPRRQPWQGCTLPLSYSRKRLLRVKGLEPPRRKTLDPKSSASTSSATLATTIATAMMYINNLTYVLSNKLPKYFFAKIHFPHYLTFEGAVPRESPARRPLYCSKPRLPRNRPHHTRSLNDSRVRV